jgi:hypothetical protein
VAGQQDVLAEQPARETLHQHFKQLSAQTLSARAAALNCILKFNLMATADCRTYIRFTHSAF